MSSTHRSLRQSRDGSIATLSCGFRIAALLLLTLASTAAFAQSTSPNFTYVLETNGRVVGYFSECSGLGSENAVVERVIKNRDGAEQVIKVPGRLKVTDVTLKRGITSSLDLWVWREEVVNGQVDSARRDGSIIMVDQGLHPVAQWNFVNAWPSRVHASGNGDAALEEVTIVFEYIEREAL